MLAVIDGGGPNPSEAMMRSYARALDLLERVCPEGRTMISDMAVKAQQILRDNNLDESVLEILGNLRLSIPEEAGRGDVGDCTSVLATYLALRIGE